MFAIGTQVGYDECFRGIRWTKIGTVVEIGSGYKGGRIRVLWSKWVYASGTEKPDNKRTWVAASKLKTIPKPE